MTGKSQTDGLPMDIGMSTLGQQRSVPVIKGVNPDFDDNDFYFQWHITDRCNLRCSHCYQDDYSYSSELSLSELQSIADQINQALGVWKKDGRVAITGGEPFVREDLINLLQYIEQKPNIKKIGILTNGTLTRDHIDYLRKITKLHYVQLSLEGRKQMNDEIRGKGVFDEVIECTNLLKKCEIPVRWMITIHKKNVLEVPFIIDLARDNDVDVLTFERLIPTGTGKFMKDMLISPQDLSTVFGYILMRSDGDFNNGTCPSILKLRTLWILTDPTRAEKNIQIPFQNEVGASCSIGMDSLCILPDATVLPCRRLPISIGNLKKDSLFKIWYSSPLLWEIRNKNNLKGKCNGCEFIPRCGGCRAMAYAMTGDYMEEDPQCWKE